VLHSRPSFGLEWGCSFLQPDCRSHNRKTALKLRLNGAPDLDLLDWEEALTGPPAKNLLLLLGRLFRKPMSRRRVRPVSLAVITAGERCQQTSGPH
jgi:hypothetical protein